jgi:hypothetical protein
MRHVVAHLLVVVVGVASYVNSQDALKAGGGGAAAIPHDNAPAAIRHRFHLPAPHQVNMTGPISCSPVATAGLRPDQEATSWLNATVTNASDRLAIEIKGNHLVVLSQQDTQHGVAEGRRYRVLSNSKQWIAAVAEDLLPAVDTLLVNKESGFAIWTVSEPWSRSFPVTRNTYLVCINHHIHVHPKK